MSGDSERIRDHGSENSNREFLEPETNPILLNSVNVAVGKQNPHCWRMCYLRVLDIAVRSGAYSGTAADIVIDRALEGFSREALRATTGVYYENYVRERALQPRWGRLLGRLRWWSLRGVNYSKQMGMLRQLEQMELDNAIAHFRGCE